MEHWIKFFLNGCIETAKSGRSTLEKIIKLRQEDEAKLFKLGKRSKTAHNLLKLLYSYPFSSIPFISRELKISHQSASKIIAEFQKSGILRETTGYSRNRIFVYDEYMKLFR
ncbi:helix-turn-helix domain-containing protein [Candidatus Magnetomonas plexicatena]|uniref:helix-turn-helix domain-containing protein n=1 Tax=Candidatus Magnetomonas plexicatena TaxID=2552947 RepID=UPI001C7744B5|nr:hypothetical protein E2O03_013605 [Nitrospirales bacterium LBB_01]